MVSIIAKVKYKYQKGVISVFKQFQLLSVAFYRIEESSSFIWWFSELV